MAEKISQRAKMHSFKSGGCSTDVSQKNPINIKIESGHLAELEERNTLKQFSAHGTVWLKRYPS
jgi:hypothetical protein